MSSDVSSQRAFDVRMAAIRHRFERDLPERLTRASRLVPLTGVEGGQGAEAVAGVYNEIHGLCGLAGTIGYPEIGSAARQVDRCLVRAFREKRQLGQADFVDLERTFRELRLVAAACFAELRSA